MAEDNANRPHVPEPPQPAAGPAAPREADRPPATPAPPAQPPALSEKDARLWAMFCHLGGLAFVLVIPFANVIAPLICWLIKKDKHPFVDREGKEALNFQISISIYAVACGLLVFAVIGLFLLPALMVFNVVMIILAAVKANNGEHFHYPLTIRFIK